MVPGRISPSNSRAAGGGPRPRRRAVQWLASLAVAAAPAAALAQSGEQLQLFLLKNSWGSLAGTGLLYAVLCLRAAQGQSFRWAAALGELALVLLGTWGTFAPDPAGPAPFYWQLAVFTLEACVLGASLLRAGQRRRLWLFAIAGWWLLPLLLYFPGLLLLGWAMPWLEAAGAALRQ